MAGLADLLLNSKQKDRLIADCVQLVEDYVAHRGGLKGVGLRYGLALVKNRKPDIVHRSTQWLLPEFLAALDPLYHRYLERDDRELGFDDYVAQHSPTAVRALIGVADRRVAGTPNTVVRSAYRRFRGDAEKEARDLIPPFTAIIARHLRAIPARQVSPDRRRRAPKA